MENNIFYKARAFHGSSSDFNGTLTIDYNGWFQCTETISGEHDTNGEDPGFIDEDSADYHLDQSSVCIDKGDPTFGDEYPGGRIDLGAYEYEYQAGLNEPESLPEQFKLFYNFPNPFNPRTTIVYKLVKSSKVKLLVYNSLGQRVNVLVNSRQLPGKHKVTFNATFLPSGLYTAVLFADQERVSRKLVLIK